MKTFFINFLECVIFIIGYVCFAEYLKLDGIHWYHPLLFIGSFLIFFPAVWWWKDYLNKLFDNKDGI